MKKRSIDDIRRDLQQAEARHDRIERLGEKAISDYDLMMGYGVEFNLKLASNHIAYYRNELEEATKYGEQLKLFES